MKKFKITLVGTEELEQELIRLNSVRFDAVVTKNTTQLFNRAKTNANNRVGGTPVDTGELRLSVRADLLGGKSMHVKDNENGGLSTLVDTSNISTFSSATVGYTKEYAPHVEYGHRTRNGGYVHGQRFLQKNVEKQKEIYITDLRRAIKKESA